MDITANSSHDTPLYSVEEFLSNSRSVDEGYGSELFAAINTLTNLTVYESSRSILFYFEADIHPLHRACTYQPLVRSINESIEHILLGMEMADPKKVVREFSWWEKFNFTHKQAEADYLSGVKNVRFNKVLMERNLGQLRLALNALREIHNQMVRALPFLTKLIDQGHIFLELQEETPDTVYDKQLDRFRRQLKNTIAFQSMAMMNEKQIEQYINVSQNTLDRANEISTILIPIWQTLYNNQNSEKHVDVAKIEEVAKLHERVIQSLKNL